MRAQARGRVRWFLCGLLFVGTTVNYIDRQAIGICAGMAYLTALGIIHLMAQRLERTEL